MRPYRQENLVQNDEKDAFTSALWHINSNISEFEQSRLIVQRNVNCSLKKGDLEIKIIERALADKVQKLICDWQIKPF